MNLPLVLIIDEKLERIKIDTIFRCFFFFLSHIALKFMTVDVVVVVGGKIVRVEKVSDCVKFIWHMQAKIINYTNSNSSKLDNTTYNQLSGIIFTQSCGWVCIYWKRMMRDVRSFFKVTVACAAKSTLHTAHSGSFICRI